MFNLTALPRTNHVHLDISPVVAALHRGFEALGALRPTRGLATSESYFDAGLVKRERQRL
jgi:hypothetical protein